ncbi:PE family protein [Mycobacterium gastri]|uniref:PE family protein n=1 Tax=Mycobacterium gastri TaxID=1777 RepID=UPI000A046A4D|nr:PE family protein [Mycobacterium gastri]
MPIQLHAWISRGGLVFNVDSHQRAGNAQSAATKRQALGSSMMSRNAAAAASTMNVIPPAADGVSALTAMHFAAHAKAFQAVYTRTGVARAGAAPMARTRFVPRTPAGG